MLGRLPLRYQLTVWSAGLLVFAVAGAVLAATTPVAVVWSSAVVAGLLAGLLAGVVLVAAFVHLLEPAPSRSPRRR